jgi:ribosome-binding ATPase YchF (GTP1/OBG family)
VIRVFKDNDVVHVDGNVDPKKDMETINTELCLADLQTLEKAIPRLEKEVRTVKEKVPVLAAAKAASQVLNQGELLRGTSVDLAAISELQLLTAKPFLYVFTPRVIKISFSSGGNIFRCKDRGRISRFR